MGASGTSDLSRRVAAVRRFNRFFTRRLGVLNRGLLDSPLSLTEVRLLYELAHRQLPTASDLKRDLALDAGYLSRLLHGFARRGWIQRRRSREDSRRSQLSLTEKGRKAFAPLDQRANDEVAASLAALPLSEQDKLVEAMGTIEHLLGERRPTATSFTLRPPRAGDLGWVVESHGALYTREYSWDEHFEALVAEIVAEFVRKFDAKRDRCWIAEMNGENVGSVFVVQETAQIAKLRLLLVAPHARGHGIGVRLVDECVRFARDTGYWKLRLWTNSVLVSARRIYEAAGFQLVSEEKHHSFGQDLVGQTWELGLR